ncbi:MAG: DUF4390 domain-containing protein [Pseudomonadota bacterium]
MRCCEKALSRLATTLALSLILLTGCGLVDGPDRFAVNDVRVSAQSDRVDAQLIQKLQLSRAAQRAMRHGVPLVLRLELEIIGDSGPGVLKRQEEVFEIRYLAMSERYELTRPAANQTRTYPRLRHVLRQLERLRVSLGATGLPEGRYTLRTRIRLDRSSLPAPLQLPAVVYGNWRHDSEWSPWPFTISA